MSQHELSSTNETFGALVHTHQGALGLTQQTASALVLQEYLGEKLSLSLVDIDIAAYHCTSEHCWITKT